VRLPGDRCWPGTGRLQGGQEAHPRPGARPRELFLQPPRGTAIDQAQAIAQEGADSTWDTPAAISVSPTLPLAFLEADKQRRFGFRQMGDLPAEGSVVIDPKTGSVLLTDLKLAYEAGLLSGSVRVVVTDSLRPDLSLFVPDLIEERYESGRSWQGRRESREGSISGAR